MFPLRTACVADGSAWETRGFVCAWWGPSASPRRGRVCEANAGLRLRCVMATGFVLTRCQKLHLFQDVQPAAPSADKPWQRSWALIRTSNEALAHWRGGYAGESLRQVKLARETEQMVRGNTRRRAQRRRKYDCLVTDAECARAPIPDAPLPPPSQGPRLRISGLSRFLLLTSLCGRQREVSAAPHRGNANKPLTNQGKAKNSRSRKGQHHKNTNKAPHRQKNQVAAGALGALEFRKYIIVDSTTAIAEATAAKRNTCA
ncbi:hypothetical protein R69888_00409 [Paraburkholderia haematera]|uniref:Uncharacterized protein n=1 Tax=Paraburkholderia haematera TaxID=2793077 RepID=A0ABN7KIE4_9BURK|nr:hypothetical protein R69888_00409 [Paraburkholderia haematera]